MLSSINDTLTPFPAREPVGKKIGGRRDAWIPHKGKFRSAVQSTEKTHVSKGETEGSSGGFKRQSEQITEMPGKSSGQ